MAKELLETYPSPPDDFDRRDDQGIWTVQYAREGKYPKTDVPQAAGSLRKKRPSKPVYGSVQREIADSDARVRAQAEQDELDRQARAKPQDPETAEFNLHMARMMAEKLTKPP